MKPVIKGLIIAATAILVLISSTSAYFDMDDVEIKDLEDKYPTQGKGTSVFMIQMPTDRFDPDIDEEPLDELEPVPGDLDGDGIAEDLDLDGKADVIEGAVNEVINTSEMPTWEASGEYMDVDKLILINKTHPVDATFEPVDLVRVDYVATNRSESGWYMTREACDAFNKLASDALTEGHEIVVTTAYRSYNFQSYLYNSYVAKDGVELADTYSARPGTSEHQSGLTADLSSPSVNYELTSNYINVPEGQWLAENCYKYGFIIRFPDGKQDITGYMYEPWHIRYVGQDAAREIYALDITLEEYLELKGI